LKLRNVALASVCLSLLMFAAAAEDITATLEVDYEGDGAIDRTAEQTLPEASTALDLLNVTTTNLTIEEDEAGIIVVGIDDVMTNYEEEGTWWLFEVNGEMVDVSVEEYVLQDGDVVTMSLAGAEEGEADMAAVSEDEVADDETEEMDEAAIDEGDETDETE
jgi:hypothetical protein